MSITFLSCAAALSGLAVAGPAGAQFFNDFTEAPHRYWDADAGDPMTLWLKDLESGKNTIPAEEQSGRPLVERLLRELNVPVSSQVLVFSKTSLQRRQVKPENPRAIYFNDDVYVGWMPGGRVEISSFDRELGTIFYYQRDVDDGPELPLFYRERVCIQCHAGSATNFIPGPLGKSVFPDASGRPTKTVASFDLAGHDVEFKDRWGGWYVTGDHGALRHMGNALAEPAGPAGSAGSANGEPRIDREKHANLASLEAFFPGDKYPATGSDILALLVLDHQISMHYRLTEARYRVRQAIHDRAEAGAGAGEETRSDYDSELETATEMVARYLFFCDEVSLGTDVVGKGSTFREAFLAAGKPAQNGHSLRDLRMKDHLFEHRCSYMIYSSAFSGLPVPLKEAIFARMKQVLKPDAQIGGYAHLGEDEKRAITRILDDTLPEFKAAGNAAL